MKLTNKIKEHWKEYLGNKNNKETEALKWSPPMLKNLLYGDLSDSSLFLFLRKFQDQ